MQEFIIKLKHRIEGKYFSNFDSVFKGSGLEIDDFRNYVAGDNPKSINWKITAKLDQVFVNVFQEEKSVDLDIFLDINYNRKGKTSAGHNSHLALNLFGDILVYAKKHLLPIKLYLPKNTTNNTKYNINHDLSEAYAFLQDFPQYLKKTSKRYQSALSQFFDEAKKNRKKRALVIISDFLAIDENDIRILKQLQKDHTIYLFRLPLDLNFGQNYEQKLDITKTIGLKVVDL